MFGPDLSRAVPSVLDKQRDDRLEVLVWRRAQRLNARANGNAT